MDKLVAVECLGPPLGARPAMWWTAVQYRAVFDSGCQLTVPHEPNVTGFSAEDPQQKLMRHYFLLVRDFIEAGGIPTENGAARQNRANSMQDRFVPSGQTSFF